MTTFAVKNNFLPPGLVSNLQEVLLNRKGGAQNDKDQQSKPKNDDPSTQPLSFDSVPMLLLTPTAHNQWYWLQILMGLNLLVLPVLLMLLFVKASVVLTYALPNRVVAGVREALFNDVPSISISLDWRNDESQESVFKDVVSVCLPLINAVIRKIEKGAFPKSCVLHIGVSKSPLTNKGFKLTKQSLWSSKLCWQAKSSARNLVAARFLPNQQSLGMQLAQLGRDASATVSR